MVKRFIAYAALSVFAVSSMHISTAQATLANAGFFPLQAQELSNGIELNFNAPDVLDFEQPAGFFIYRQEFNNEADVPTKIERFVNDTGAKQVLMGSKRTPVANVEVVSQNTYAHLDEVRLDVTGEIAALDKLYLYYGDYQLSDAKSIDGAGEVFWDLTGIDQIYLPDGAEVPLTIYADLHSSNQQIPLGDDPFQIEVNQVTAQTPVDRDFADVDPEDRVSEQMFPVHNLLRAQINPSANGSQDRASPILNENLFAFDISGDNAPGSNVEAKFKKFRLTVTGNAVASNFELYNVRDSRVIQDVAKNVDCHPGNGVTSIEFDLTNAAQRDSVLDNSTLNYAIRAKVFSQGADGAKTSSLGFAIQNLGSENSNSFANSDVVWEDTDRSINEVRERFWIDQATNSISSSIIYSSETDTGVDAACLALAHDPSSFLASSQLVVANGSGTQASFERIAVIGNESETYVDNDVIQGKTYQYFVVAIDGDNTAKVRSELVTITAANVETNVVREDNEEVSEESEEEVKPPAGEETETTSTESEETEPPAGEEIEELENETPEVVLLEVPFSDIANEEWYTPYIQSLYSRNIVGGFSDNTFRPNQAVTRAEFLKMAIEAHGGVEVTAIAQGFSDVSTDDWFQLYVSQARVMNLVQGYSDGTFRPNQQITRAEALKILFALYGLNPTETQSDSSVFVDIAQHWAQNYILSALNLEIVTPRTFFEPDRGISRAEVAKLILEVEAQVSQ